MLRFATKSWLLILLAVLTAANALAQTPGGETTASPPESARDAGAILAELVDREQLDPSSVAYWSLEAKRLEGLEERTKGENERLLLAYRRLDMRHRGLRLVERLAEAEPDEHIWECWHALFLMRNGRYLEAGEAIEAAAESADLSAFGLAGGLYAAHAGAFDRAIPYLAQAGLDEDFTSEVLVHLILLHRDRRAWRQEAYSRHNLSRHPLEAWPAEALRWIGLESNFQHPASVDRPRWSVKFPENFESARLPWERVELRTRTAKGDAVTTPPVILRGIQDSARAPMLRATTPELGELRLLLSPIGPQALLLDDDLAARLPAGIESQSAAGFRILSELDLGGVVLRDVVAVFHDLPLSVTQEAAISGILSVPALEPMSVTFDLAADSLFIEREHLFYDVEVETPMLSVAGVPLLVGRSPAGEELLVAVNSLAMDPLIAPEWLGRLSAGSWQGPGSHGSMLRLLENDLPLPKLRVATGEEFFPNPPLARIGLTLGLDTLGQVFETITFDYPMRAIVARPVPELQKRQ